MGNDNRDRAMYGYPREIRRLEARIKYLETALRDVAERLSPEEQEWVERVLRGEQAA